MCESEGREAVWDEISWLTCVYEAFVANCFCNTSKSSVEINSWVEQILQGFVLNNIASGWFGNDGAEYFHHYL